MKKRVIYGAICILLLFIQISFGQQQRLGIRPQEIVLEGGKTSEVIEAYCFDRHVNINEGNYDYKYLQTDKAAIKVIVDDKTTYSFSDAIANKTIEVFGRSGREREPRLVIEIKKNVPQKVVIKVEKVSVFRDTEGVYENQKSLDALSSSDISGDYDKIQNSIWEADVDRSRLESLGYKSKEDFLEKNKLSKENITDEQVSGILEKQETSLIKYFESIYLMDINHLGDTIKSVSDNIERLQKIYGEKVTGRFGPDVRDLLLRYEKDYLPLLVELRELSIKSQTYVFKAKAVIGDDKAYTFYTPLGAFRENDTESLKYVMTLLSFIRTQDRNMILELPSKQKEEGLKTTLNSFSINYLKGDTKAIRYYLLGGKITKLVSVSPILRTKDGFSSTATYEVEKVTTVQKMTVSARAKQTVSKFVQTFKSLINGERSVSSIASEARKSSGSVTLGFEVGKIELIKRFRDNSFEINVE